MTFEQYQLECKRTCTDASSKLLDSFHMTSGMFTEIGEIMECLYLKPLHQSYDFFNLREEVGDLLWYCGNFATFFGYKLTDIPFRDKSYYFTEGVEPLNQLTLRVARLQDFDKKELAYSRAKNPDKVIVAFYDVLKAISDFCVFYGIIPEEAMEVNIKKLRTRYPEKFTEELAINRDLTNERKILEQ